MGFNLTWLLVEKSSRETIFQDLAVRPEAVSANRVSSGVAGRSLDDGGYLVLAINAGDQYLDSRLMGRISSDATALLCHVYEGCMHALAARWIEGRQTWHVEHDGDRGHLHLDVVGSPPPALASLRAAASAAQNAESRPKPGPVRAAPPAELPPDLMQLASKRGWVLSAVPPAIGVDHMFDIPVDLCEAESGLRHTRTSFWDGHVFDILIPIA